jgi:hypothetical protein
LRERRTLSTTVFCGVSLVIILVVSNTFTGGERDNIYIIAASVVLLISLYLQACAGQRELASNLAIFAYWAVTAMAMTTAGVGGNTWAWLLVLPAISSLVAGRPSVRRFVGIHL